MKLLNGLPVPDLDGQASIRREQAETAVHAVIDGLKRGENFILWPSGRIQRAASRCWAARVRSTDILQAAPEATVVLVRTQRRLGQHVQLRPRRARSRT